MKRILITGANSYIGTSVEKYLAQWPDQYQVDTIDMIDGSWREKSFAGYDSVFHVAGIAHINTKKLNQDARDKYWSVNAILPVAVAKKAKDEGVKQFIFLSSMSVYGLSSGVIKNSTPLKPTSIYGKSKIKAEQALDLIANKDFAIAILRPPIVYGRGCKGNYQLLSKFARISPVYPIVFNQRSMLYIDNLSTFIKSCIDGNLSGCYHPQNAEYVCTSEMIKAVADCYQHKIFGCKLLGSIIKRIPLSIIKKTFHDLYYTTEIADAQDLVSFIDSVRITEGCDTNTSFYGSHV